MKKRKVFIRIAYSMGLLMSVLFLEWWFVMVFIVMGVVFFQHYYEAVVAGILTDILFGTDSSCIILNTHIIFTSFSLFAYMIISCFKTRVPAYG